MAGTTLCPRCGAPIPWDGVSKTVHCSYCNVMVTPTAMGGPPRMPGAVSTGGGTGMGIGCAIAGVVGALAIGGALVGWLMFRSAAPTPMPTISLTPPEITMPTMPALAAKAPKPAAIATWGESGNGAGQLTDARSIAVDMDENVYVADYDTLRVQKFDATGKFQWIISVPKDEFAGNKQIWGLAVDSKNVLWVARTGALLKYATADGKAAGQVKGNYDNMWFKFVALDALGNIATLHDARGDTDLLLLDPNGKLRKRIKNKPDHGLAMDGAGNVFISDEFEGQIEVLDPQGTVKSKFGSKADKHTARPGALAVDNKGHVFAETGEGLNVFDQGGSYIKTIDTSGITSLRSFAISSKGHLFVLGNDKVAELEIGALP